MSNRWKTVTKRGYDYTTMGVEDTYTGKRYGGYDIICKVLNDFTEEWDNLKKERLELYDEIRILQKKLKDLEDLNKEYIEIEDFAKDYGISIISIKDAFRRCWNDNKQLVSKIHELEKKEG